MSRRWILLGIGALALGGCSAKQLAPAETASRRERHAAKQDAKAPIKAAGDQGGLDDYLDKPEVRVARLGARWGLRLSEIRDRQHRGWVVRDLRELEALRKKYKLSPPGRSRLFVAGKGLYAVLLLPAAFSTREPRRVDLHVWDYSGARRQTEPLLTAQPGGRLRAVGGAVRAGGRADRAYTFLARQAGPMQVQLTLTRSGKRLFERNVAVAASARLEERP